MLNEYMCRWHPEWVAEWKEERMAARKPARRAFWVTDPNNESKS